MLSAWKLEESEGGSEMIRRPSTAQRNYLRNHAVSAWTSERLDSASRQSLRRHCARSPLQGSFRGSGIEAGVSSGKADRVLQRTVPGGGSEREECGFVCLSRRGKFHGCGLVGKPASFRCFASSLRNLETDLGALQGSRGFLGVHAAPDGNGNLFCGFLPGRSGEPERL